MTAGPSVAQQLVINQLHGSTGTYADLKAAVDKAELGKWLQVDHIPSHASNLRAYEAANGLEIGELSRTGGVSNEILKNGGAMIVTTEEHQNWGRTFGGRNQRALQLADAADPNSAIEQDLQRYVDNGVITSEQKNAALDELAVLRGCKEG